jgi:hypothetical protein
MPSSGSRVAPDVGSDRQESLRVAGALVVERQGQQVVSAGERRIDGQRLPERALSQPKLPTVQVSFAVLNLNGRPQASGLVHPGELLRIQVEQLSGQLPGERYEVIGVRRCDILLGELSASHIVSRSRGCGGVAENPHAHRDQVAGLCCGSHLKAVLRRDEPLPVQVEPGQQRWYGFRAHYGQVSEVPENVRETGRDALAEAVLLRRCRPEPQRDGDVVRGLGKRVPGAGLEQSQPPDSYCGAQREQEKDHRRHTPPADKPAADAEPWLRREQAPFRARSPGGLPWGTDAERKGGAACSLRFDQLEV